MSLTVVLALRNRTRVDAYCFGGGARSRWLSAELPALYLAVVLAFQAISFEVRGEDPGFRAEATVGISRAIPAARFRKMRSRRVGVGSAGISGARSTPVQSFSVRRRAKCYMTGMGSRKAGQYTGSRVRFLT